MVRVTPIVKSQNLETLEDRRTKSKVITIQTALNYNLEIEPNKNMLRCSDKHIDKGIFFIPYARTNAYKYSFFPSDIRARNGLPEQARITSNLTSFKTLVGMRD